MNTGREYSQIVSRAHDHLEREHNTQELEIDKESIRRALRERAESALQDWLDDEGYEGVEFDVEVTII